MRRDITELKQQLEGLRASQRSAPRAADMPIYADAEEVVPVVHQPVKPTIHLAPSTQVHQVVEEYVDEALSLDDVEKKTIKQALERHRGRRRDAAKELNISERTLYRKIKEYGIE